jgi:hypothetical protein
MNVEEDPVNENNCHANTAIWKKDIFLKGSRSLSILFGLVQVKILINLI